ncbi:MAG: hypothetical protein II304_03125 [Bacteroidales bacterium]|nr:hypothetical protein [Bacteroidales bacterium]
MKSYEVFSNGDIKMLQGETIEFVVNGLPTDENYKLFWEVQNEDRTRVGNQLEFDTLNLPSVTIKALANFTNLFVVPSDEKSAKYYHALKLCSVSTKNEITLRFKGKQIGDRNIITVFPRQAEGL